MSDNEEDTFTQIVKYEKKKRIMPNFSPTMLDYGLDNKSTMRFEWIKSIEDVNERIEEMGKLLKEIINQPFPDEFYPWLARDMLKVKYTKNQINDMKREYRIKKKRELKKQRDKEKRNNCNKNKQKKKPLTMTKSHDPFTIKFD
jgi:hypothetical protein